MLPAKLLSLGDILDLTVTNDASWVHPLSCTKLSIVSVPGVAKAVGTLLYGTWLGFTHEQGRRRNLFREATFCLLKYFLPSFSCSLPLFVLPVQFSSLKNGYNDRIFLTALIQGLNELIYIYSPLKPGSKQTFFKNMCLIIVHANSMSGFVLGAMVANMKTPALLLTSSDICKYFVFVGCAALKYGWPGFETSSIPSLMNYLTSSLIAKS